MIMDGIEMYIVIRLIILHVRFYEGTFWFSIQMLGCILTCFDVRLYHWVF